MLTSIIKFFSLLRQIKPFCEIYRNPDLFDKLFLVFILRQKQRIVASLAGGQSVTITPVSHNNQLPAFKAAHRQPVASSDKLQHPSLKVNVTFEQLPEIFDNRRVHGILVIHSMRFDEIDVTKICSYNQLL